MNSVISKYKLASLLLLSAGILFACGILAPAAPATNPTEVIPPQTESQSTTESTSESNDSIAEATETVETVEITPEETVQEADIEPSRDLDETFEPFWEAVDLLERYYVEQPLDIDTLAEGAITGLQSFTETVDLSVIQPVSVSLAEEFSDAADTPRKLEEAFLPFWQYWAAAGEARGIMLMRASLNGMVDSLGDRHTSYMDPDQLIQANIPLDGTYEGIGAWVDPNTEYLTIVSPMPGSPAEAAGLLPGDQIIAIEGEDMTGIDGNLVIRRVLGPAGTDVTLTIRRDGVEDFDVVVTRAKIVIPSVDGYIIEDTNIAYVALFTFGETTTEDLRNILKDLLAQNPDGLIFDLRNNGGGYLVTSIEVASEFIAEGLILSEVYGDGTRDTYDALGDGLATEIPLVVLVNGGSASASEIVAGAVQAYDRGPLVGTTTFGKGTVQNWVTLIGPEYGAMRITIAKWLSPGDLAIHEIGLEPDYVVEFTEEDVANGVDPQLDKAIELLTQQ